MLSKELMQELGISGGGSLVINNQKQRTYSNSSGGSEGKKKESAKKKQRDKKKMNKFLERKKKETKMKEIMASLTKHSSDITDKDFDKFQSAKHLGNNDKKKNQQPLKEKEHIIQSDDIEEEEKSIERELKYIETDDHDKKLHLTKLNEGPAQLQNIADLMNTVIIEREEEPDSDEEQKKDMLSYNEKLFYINSQDLKRYGKQTKKDISEEEQTLNEEEQKLNQLPIIYHEREIMENIENQIVTIVCGETGSGKSTQIPQFIYSSSKSNPWKFKNSSNKLLIGVTQPRRVAAVSLAKRVSEELKTKLGDDVGYQIRYDAAFYSQDKTKIKYMTDGILLKEIENDFLLKHYSVIVIDEAHERSLNSDILVSLLTRIAHVRCELACNERKEQNKNDFIHYPLRLVIMSATLRVEDFRDNKRLFPPSISMPPPVIKVDARQFPVTIHYSKVTKDDYLEEAFKKCCKIHKNLPSGGILVFLTGKKEITYLSKRLNIELNRKSEKFIGKKRRQGEDGEEKEIQHNLRVQVLPLYSQLSPEKQYLVFDNPKPGHRLIVVATNVAETSITIPNMRYVVDSGKAKEKIFDKTLQMSQFQIQWISQASAEQRAGRAGRTGPGHCYRLYSTAVFSKLPLYSEPEILKAPLDQTMLQLKSLGVEDLLRFPFVTKPPTQGIKAALRHLCILGAFDFNQKDFHNFSNTTQNQIDDFLAQGKDYFNSLSNDPTQINDLGQLLSKIPISPKFSKMLVVSTKYEILKFAIMMVSCMSVSEIFSNNDIKDVIVQDENDEQYKRMQEMDRDLITSIDVQNMQQHELTKIKKAKDLKRQQIHQIKQQRAKWYSQKSDLILYPKLMVDYFNFINQNLNDNGLHTNVESLINTFCTANNLQYKAMKEVHFLCLQLQRIMDQQRLNTSEKFNFSADQFCQPTDKEEQILQQIIISGLCENLARKCPIFDSQGNQIKHTAKLRGVYESQESKDKLSLHPFSCLYKEKPEFIVYQEVYGLDNRDLGGDQKCYLKGATKIDNLNWVYNLASKVLLTTSKPITDENNVYQNVMDLKIARSMAKGTSLISYDSEKDQVLLFVRVYYGQQRWPLNIQQVSLKSIEASLDSEEYYQYFGFCLLEGLVFDKIKQIKKYFTSSPREILEKGNMTSKITRMIATLKQHECDSKEKCIAIWKEKNQYFLLDVVLLWVGDKDKGLIEKLILKLNQNAMDSLKEGKSDICKELLMKAESSLLSMDKNHEIMSKSGDAVNFKNKLLGITYNNLGCFFKQKNQHQVALKYLRQGLTYESLYEMSGEGQFTNTASTLLNICAILSKINRHEQALKYAEDAILKSEKYFKRESFDISQNQSLITTMVIAYYNKAVELEFLQRFQDSQNSYEYALQIAQDYLSDGHNLMFQIKQGIDKMKIKTGNGSQNKTTNHQTLRAMQNTYVELFEFVNTSPVPQQQQTVMKDMYKIAKNAYKSRRGKGPKQGSLSISKENIRFNSTQMQLSHFGQSREQSPIQEMSNLSQISKKDEAKQETIELRVRTKTQQEQLTKIGNSVRLHKNQNLDANFQRLTTQKQNIIHNFYLPSLHMKEDPLQHSFSKRPTEIKKYLLPLSPTNQKAPQTANRKEMKSLNNQLNKLIPATSKYAWSSDRNKALDITHIEQLHSQFQQKIKEEGRLLKQHYDYSKEERLSQTNKSRFVNKRPAQQEDSSYRSGLGAAELVYSSGAYKQSQLRALNAVKHKLAKEKVDLMKIQEAEYFQKQQIKIQSDVLSAPQSPKFKLFSEQHIGVTFTPEKQLQQSQEYAVLEENRKIGKKIISPYYVKISKQYSIKKKIQTNENKRSLIDYQSYIIENSKDDLDQFGNFDEEDDDNMVQPNNPQATYKIKTNLFEEILMQLPQPNRSSLNEQSQQRFEKIECAISRLNEQLGKFQLDLQVNLNDPCLLTSRQSQETKLIETMRSEIRYDELSEAYSLEDICKQ